MIALPAAWRALLGRILWLDALHAAAISAAPVLLAVLLGEPRVGWMAISSFWACYGDPGGPMRQRVGAMLLLGLGGAAFCFLASASAPYLWLLLPLTFLCCTAGGLLRVLGPSAAIMGTLLSAGFVVSCELPVYSLTDSLHYAGLFLAGALWAILMTAVVWRRRPWKDATHSVAHCYRGLADFADALAQLYSGLGARDSATAWTEVGRANRAGLRGAIEAARGRIEEVSDTRPSRAARGQQLRFLLQSAEESFIALVAVAELMESHRLRWHGREAGACLAHGLHRLASLCNAIAATSNTADAAEAERLHKLTAQFDAGLRDIRGRAMAYAPDIGVVLPAFEKLQRAVKGVADSLFDGGQAAQAGAGGTTRGAGWLPDRNKLRSLGQNLNWQSDALRHAMRVGVGATIAVALTKTFAVNHGYWMSLTLVFILQPYFASTWTRTMERVLGSVCGAVGASLLGLLLSSPLSVALALLPIAVGTFVSRSIHYALFTFFLTSQFVLVSHIQQPTVYEPTLAALRGLNSVFGGVLALLVAYFLWPTSEPRELAGALTQALSRHADYIRALLQAKSRADEIDADVVALRRDACLAADNAEASLSRMQQNPLHRERKYDTAVSLLNSMRRMTAAGTVLEMQPAMAPGANDDARAALARYGTVLGDTLLPGHPARDANGARETPVGGVACAPSLAIPSEVAGGAATFREPLSRLADEVRRAARLLARVLEA